MVNNSKSTIYYRLLTLCKNSGKFYKPEPNTTLATCGPDQETFGHDLPIWDFSDRILKIRNTAH